MTNIVLYKDVNNNLWLYEGYEADIKMHKVIVVDEDDGYYTNTNITCYLTDEELAQCTEVHINIHKYEDDDCVPTVLNERGAQKCTLNNLFLLLPMKIMPRLWCCGINTTRHSKDNRLPLLMKLSR